jgi:hypothetical protein
MRIKKASLKTGAVRPPTVNRGATAVLAERARLSTALPATTQVPSLEAAQPVVVAAVQKRRRFIPPSE